MQPFQCTPTIAELKLRLPLLSLTNPLFNHARAICLLYVLVESYVVALKYWNVVNEYNSNEMTYCSVFVIEKQNHDLIKYILLCRLNTTFFFMPTRCHTNVYSQVIFRPKDCTRCHFARHGSYWTVWTRQIVISNNARQTITATTFSQTLHQINLILQTKACHNDRCVNYWLCQD